MPEILTESFCERCGTRYTFESAAPAKGQKLGRFKTLSKGLKNYVLSDDTSLDEAMAEARNDEERQLTAQQLDAFHATFNFCMQCRQYTCGNCWNDAEGRCLTCAPHLGHEILQAPFPTLATESYQPAPRADEAWPTADVAAETVDGSNGHVEEIDLAARLAQLSGNGAHGVPVVEPAPVEFEADVEPVAAIEPVAETAPEPVADVLAKTTAPEPATTPTPPVAEFEPLATDIDERAAAAAARTSALLSKFRPGQNIDAELAAYEASVAATDDGTEVEPIAASEGAAMADASAEAEVTEPEPVAAAAEPEAIVAEPEPVAAVAEPEPIAVEAQPEPVAAAEPAPEPVAAIAEPQPIAAEPEPIAAPEPEPIAASAEPQPPVGEQPAEPIAADAAPVAPRVDHVEQPTWRIVAPDVPGSGGASDQVDPGLAAAARTTAPADEPSWPVTPQWPTAAPGASFLSDRLASRASTEALWAASARDVVSQPEGAPATGVQPCSNCGLSLSATARFCRRCGTHQGA